MQNHDLKNLRWLKVKFRSFLHLLELFMIILKLPFCIKYAV